jgi:hypothetical protein
VGPKISLNNIRNEKILDYRNSNSDLSAIQPAAGRYYGCAIIIIITLFDFAHYYYYYYYYFHIIVLLLLLLLLLYLRYAVSVIGLVAVDSAHK